MSGGALCSQPGCDGDHHRFAEWDRRFLEVAKLISSWSKDPSTKIGCVLVRDRHIIATGYNGFPRGVEDTPDRLNVRETKYKLVVHAEENAILQAAKLGLSTRGTTLYCWCTIPCERCMTSIINAGITRIVCLKNEADPEMAKRWPRGLSPVMAKEGRIELVEVDMPR